MTIHTAIKGANDQYEDDNFVIKSGKDLIRHVERLRNEVAKNKQVTYQEAAKRLRFPKDFKISAVKAYQANLINTVDIGAAGLGASTVYSWQAMFKTMTNGSPMPTKKPTFSIPKSNPLDKRIHFVNAEIARMQKKLGALESIKKLDLSEDELKDVLGFTPSLSDSK